MLCDAMKTFLAGGAAAGFCSETIYFLKCGRRPVQASLAGGEATAGGNALSYGENVPHRRSGVGGGNASRCRASVPRQRRSDGDRLNNIKNSFDSHGSFGGKGLAKGYPDATSVFTGTTFQKVNKFRS